MNALEKIRLIEGKHIEKKLPEFKVGDSVKMMIKVTEADKVRLHPFEGIVIAKKGSPHNRGTFTVRKISFGEGVEKVFPFHSPVIESLKVTSKAPIQRAKLYYLRGRIGKKGKIKGKEQTQTAAPQPIPA